MYELMADMEVLRHQMKDVNEQLGVPVDERQHSRISTDPMSTSEPKFMVDMMSDMAELSREIKELKAQMVDCLAEAGDWLGVAAVEEPQPTKKKKKKKKKKKECNECGSTGHATTNCTTAHDIFAYDLDHPYDIFAYDLDHPKARPQM